jgi:serine/threonine-protein kinase
MSQVDSWQGAVIVADAEDEVVGKTLNNTYSVERIVGEGAMGRVYQARHTRIAQKCVAVKVLRPEHLRNAEVLARFQREAETAASICHPNVVAVYDVDRTPQGLSYLVTEYLEGLDLGQHLKQQKKLGLPTAVHIARQMCEGLGAAHRCGVIHRDLKPSNIFLVGDFAGSVPELPFIKILDFGLSKFMDAPVGELVTETGIIMGTPAFMPPEQAQGQHADLRADIYGVGALLYICLTGRLPFDEATPQATVLAVIGTEPPRPRALAPSIPEYAELVIQRAMAKLPAARYPDMAALLDALEPLVEDEHVCHEVWSSRPRPRASFDAQFERAETARPQLVLFLCLAPVLLLGSAAVAVAGIEQTTGWSLTRRELGLLLACGAAVAITPTVLAVLRIRRLVWENTNRVLELLSRVRIAVFTAVATYGLAWFGSRVFDGVVLRLMGKPVRVNLSWPGWDFLLPLIAVGAGVVALLRERALSEKLSGRRRALVVTLASVATLSLVAVAIPVGLRWQAQQARAARARAAETHSSVVRSISLREPESPASSAISASAAPKESVSPAASSLPTQLASEEELRMARGQGVDGWLPLADRYPTDARVLRALVWAYANHAAGLGDAMMVARRLLHVAPEEAKSGGIRYLVQRAAETRGAPAELAWQMMAEEMGIYGPDMLYRLTLTKPKLAQRAEQLLGDAAVHQRLSPALAVAHELRSASSCPARLTLLERAIEVGDNRALAVLAGLSTGTARGCGKNKRKPCLPACPEQVDQFRAAIVKLSQRLMASSK